MERQSPFDRAYVISIAVVLLLSCAGVIAQTQQEHELCGFYHDLTQEHHTTYVLETGKLGREDP
jgi:hypothetical protein